MKKLIFTNLFVFLVSAVLAFPALAEPVLSTPAKQAIVIDYDTGIVLLEKNADEQMPTSSMSKIMTAYMVFDAIKNGNLSMNDKFTVSEKAWRKGGSKMFVEVDKKVRVEDLLRGILVQSGNDATIVVAEGLAGTEEAFAQAMNAKAHELGMSNSHFANASGWPDPNHYSTARDLATLARDLIHRFPEFYPICAEPEFTFNNITQKNRNPLLYRNIGADGVKTGHTEDGGYGLIGSGTFKGRRVIIVVNGLESSVDRAQESARLLEWGLKSFKNTPLFSEGDIVGNIGVAYGKDKEVPAVIKDDLTVTMPAFSSGKFAVSANYMEPLVAPIQEGQEVGTLSVDIPQIGKIERKLYAGANVEKQGFVAGVITKAKMFFMGQY